MNSPLQPLTPKEKKVLEFIETFLSQQGIAPSYQEIKEYFGFASFNSVQRYLKQLQRKQYIHIPGGNQKRAITILQSSQAIQSSLNHIQSPTSVGPNPFVHPNLKETSSVEYPQAESLSLPLLGRVAAGQPLEAFEYDEFTEVPRSLLRNPSKSFALKVEGQSMIDDGILDGDIILVQKQAYANNGDIIVATVDNEATVKRYYFHSDNVQFLNKQSQTPAHHQTTAKIELRPANAEMEPMWFAPDEVDIRGIVVGLIRRF